MLEKTLATLAIFTGVITVVVLIILRRNPYEEPRDGSKAVRRLIKLGVATLASLGISVPFAACENNQGSIQVVKGTDTLTVIMSGANRSVARTSQWKKLAAVWNEASVIVAGEKGGYPFTAPEKKQLMEGLDQAIQDIDALHNEGLLSFPEAQLLKNSLEGMKNDVNRYRTTEEKNATCYIGGMYFPADVSMERLMLRLPLLEEAVTSGTIQSEVAEKVLANMEHEITVIWERKGGHGPLARTVSADSLTAEARLAIRKIRTIIGDAESKLEK